MKFFISNDIRKNQLLKLIIVFTLIYFLMLWITNLLLYMEIGLDYASVVKYYRGAEEEFRQPKSYLGLLQESHFHFFSMAIILVTLNHLILFTGISGRSKLIIILSSFSSALGDIMSGWLIRYVAPQFAYLKIVSFLVLQISFLLLIYINMKYLYPKDSS